MQSVGNQKVSIYSWATAGVWAKQNNYFIWLPLAFRFLWESEAP